MNSIVLKHINVNDLPVSWRAQLYLAHDAHVTVCIEEEADADVEKPGAATDLKLSTHGFKFDRMSANERTYT